MTTPTVATEDGPYSVNRGPEREVRIRGERLWEDTVSQYTVGASGSLTSMVNPNGRDRGRTPPAVTVDPSGQYVYVANVNDDTVSQYTVGADGSLTSMATPTVATGRYP